MLVSTKRMLKKWIFRLSAVLAVILLCFVNVRRLNNNIYSNYERAVDYGRVREKKEIIEPVIAAVFYQGNKEKQKNVYTYLNHSDNYKKQNVKIITVPTNLNKDAVLVIERLYTEVNKSNKIKKAVLLVSDDKNVKEHKELLQKSMLIDDIQVVMPDEIEDFLKQEIDKCLQEDGTVVVTAVDLNNKIKDDKSNFLIEKIITLAQKYFYKAFVFDAVDTQMIKAVDIDYKSMYSTDVLKEEPLLVKQQRNLQKYVNQYREMLLKYYWQNFLLGDEKETIWPAKSEKTYRLYDRGAVYMRFFDENGKELFSRAKIGKNKGIIVSVVELARKSARKISQPIKSFKIYLFTDFEPIDWKGDNLVNYLETDDGVYIQYKNKKALMVYDERSQNSSEWLKFLFNKAGVPEDVKKSDIKLYRFKTVEIKYEN